MGNGNAVKAVVVEIYICIKYSASKELSTDITRSVGGENWREIHSVISVDCVAAVLSRRASVVLSVMSFVSDTVSRDEPHRSTFYHQDGLPACLACLARPFLLYIDQLNCFHLSSIS